MSNTPAWSVGTGAIEGSEKIVVQVNGDGVFLSPKTARRMATFLLLCAEDCEKENVNNDCNCADQTDCTGDCSGGGEQ